jgi:phage nucleotide-binding protein
MQVQKLPIAERIKKADEVADKWGIDMFLTGQPGAGKTWLIGSGIQDPEMCGEIMIIDVNGGMRTLADQHGISVLSPDDAKDIDDLYEYLNKQGAADPNLMYTIAIDLASEAYKLILRKHIKAGHATKSGQPTQECFGIANTEFIEMIRKWRLLSTKYGWNVIFTSHANETKDDESGTIIVRPNLTPGTLSSVIGAVDVATYLELRNKRRLVYMVGTERFWAKVRLPQSFGTLPDFVENVTLGQLLRVLRGQRTPESLKTK